MTDGVGVWVMQMLGQDSDEKGGVGMRRGSKVVPVQTEAFFFVCFVLRCYFRAALVVELDYCHCSTNPNSSLSFDME